MDGWNNKPMFLSLILSLSLPLLLSPPLPLSLKINLFNEGISFFVIFYLFIFREGKGGRKRGREISMCGCLLSTTYWRPGPHPRMFPDRESNRWPLVQTLALNLLHTSQGKDILKKRKENSDKASKNIWGESSGCHIWELDCLSFSKGKGFGAMNS